MKRLVTGIGKLIIGGVLGLFALVVLVYVFSAANVSEEPLTREPLTGSKLEILDHNPNITEGGALCVEGRAKNITDRKLDYAEVVVKFYDNDVVESTSRDFITDLDPGEIWHFEVMFLGELFTDYKIFMGMAY